MMKLLKMIAAAIVASISLEVSAGTAENSQKLSGSQIRAKFTGMQLTHLGHGQILNQKGEMGRYQPAEDPVE
jgi:hypothetical protein